MTTTRLSQRQAGNWKMVGGRRVWVEPLEDDIIAQASAIRTARVQGMQNPSNGKKIARSKAPRLRHVTGIAMGGILVRLAKERLGANA